MYPYDQPVKSFVSGFRSVFQGFQLVISVKGFRRFIVFPFLINVIILSAGIYLAVTYLYPGLYSLIPDYNNIFIDMLRVIAKPLFICIVVFMTIMVYSLTGTISCAPFLDFVSAKTERHIKGSDGITGNGWFWILKSIFVTFRNTVGLLLIFITFNIIIFVINFIPILGSILYGVLSFSALMMFIGYQFYDLNVERHGLPFSAKFGILWNRKWSCMGIGIAFMILTYIPIIGFLATVAATSGAAIIFSQKGTGK